MDLDKSTGYVLRYGVYVAIAIMVLGLVVQQFAEVGGTIINVGVGLLVLTPFFSIIMSAFALYTERDYKWLRVAMCVLLISIVGIVSAFFT